LLAACEAEIKSLQTLEEHEVGYDAGALERKKRTGLPLVMDLIKFRPDFSAVGEAFLNEFGQVFLSGPQTEDAVDSSRWAYLRAHSSTQQSSSLLQCIEGNIPSDLKNILGSIELVIHFEKFLMLK